MTNLNNILVPYDFSEYANVSLSYAIKLAEKGANITLLHIIEIPYLHDPIGLSYYEQFAKELHEKTKKDLESLVSEYNSKYPDLKFNIEMYTNIDPAECIIEEHQEHNYDIIIMGSHGRKGLNRLLVGSIAESVLRMANCPVLIVKK